MRFKKWHPMRPSQKAVRAGIAAQAPPEWEQPEVKKRSKKVESQELPEGMRGEDNRD